MKTTTAALVTVIALGITACGSDSSSSATTTATTPNESGSAGTDATPAVGLTISGRAFSAATVQAGQPFTIVNDDGFGHTVTDRDGAFDVKVGGGSSATLTIDQPGTYSIYCKIHPDMAGTITVE